MDRMKKKKIIILLTSMFSIPILVIIGMYMYQFVGLLMYGISVRNEPNRMDFKSLEYYEKIKSLDQEKIKLNEIFDFEWDSAFVQNDANEPQESLNEKLGFEANMSILEVIWGFPQRIIFISNKEVVFEFIYDLNFLAFAENKDIFFYPDTSFTKTGKKPIIISQSDTLP